MSTAIAQQKIRIRLKAFDRRMLDLSCEKIIQTADTTSASAIGPIPLPTKRKIYCVLSRNFSTRLLIYVPLVQETLKIATLIDLSINSIFCISTFLGILWR